MLRPWVSDALQRFFEADVWLSGDTDFELCGVRFQLRHVGPAHSAEDLALFVLDDGVLYATDLTLTRDYLAYLRQEMGQAVAEMIPFEEPHLWRRRAQAPDRLTCTLPHGLK